MMDDDWVSAIAESFFTVEEAANASVEGMAEFKSVMEWWQAIVDSDLPLRES